MFQLPWQHVESDQPSLRVHRCGELISGDDVAEDREGRSNVRRDPIDGTANFGDRKSVV